MRKKPNLKKWNEYADSYLSRAYNDFQMYNSMLGESLSRKDEQEIEQEIMDEYQMEREQAKYNVKHNLLNNSSLPF